MYQNYDFSPYDHFNMGYSSMSYPMGRDGRKGLFGGRSSGNFLKSMGRRNFDWGNLLNNTQKTLGVINQAIPIFYQIKPIWNNAKVMFHIMNAVKDDDSPRKEAKMPQNDSVTFQSETDDNVVVKQNDGPQFFL